MSSTPPPHQGMVTDPVAPADSMKAIADAEAVEVIIFVVVSMTILFLIAWGVHELWDRLHTGRYERSRNRRYKDRHYDSN